MGNRRSHTLRLAAWALLITATVRAGPPFLTDDPEPVELQHWEFYVFGAGDRTPDDNTITGPAVELNYGVLNDTQLHLVVPMARYAAAGGSPATGFGDIEAGIKYRFVHETDDRPQVGIFPMIELPSGNAGRGLGNGRAWYRLPLWIQKGFGAWTTYGGGGVVLNSAPGQRNFPFAGWLVQRDLGAHLTLGGEIFSQGANTDGGRGFTAGNFGGYVNFSKNFSLLFSAGRSFAGERHTLWYLGLYWTGGKKP